MSVLTELIYSANRKAVSEEIIELALSDKQVFDELMEMFFGEDGRICQYASNPIGKIGERKPSKILPYLPRLISNLDEANHDAVIRNTLRLWAYIDFPEQYVGEVYDRCMDYLLDTKQAIAIRVFSMTVLANIAMEYPELQAELKEIIEEYYPTGTAAYTSRARKILKKFNKKK